MSEISFRRMTRDDLEKVCALENDIFSDPWSMNAFKSDLENKLAFPLVGELELSIVAYASIYIVAHEMQIGNFAVAPGYRKRGVARKLMDEILGIAGDRGCCSIFLEVRESNKPAQSLYESCGFISAGTRKNYYSRPRESAVLMVKEL
jgi:ribosomal-protein-alanine N-acetyltransferase